jgi:DNA-binding MarR family transcriptional regulator
VTAIYDEALAPTGVNLAQYSLLRTVERAGPVSLTELGRLTELDRSTIGRNVRPLERRGLVQLARGADQREATVRLDEQGRALLAKGAASWNEAQHKIEAVLGAENARQLRSLLQML